MRRGPRRPTGTTTRRTSRAASSRPTRQSIAAMTEEGLNKAMSGTMPESRAAEQGRLSWPETQQVVKELEPSKPKSRKTALE